MPTPRSNAATFQESSPPSTTRHPEAGHGRFVSDWVMVFTLRNGKVVSFQEFTDSAAIDRAYQ
jgi:ketosteroid isomerase-like protein